MNQGHPVPKGRQALACRRQGGFVPVNADEMPGGEPSGNLVRVPAAAQGAVHIDAVRANVQGIYAVRQQHGNMMKCTHRPIASREASSFSGLRFSSSNRANSAPSQISA